MINGGKSITQFFFILGGLAFAIVSVIGMVTDAQGGLAAITPLITGGVALLALVKPRAGLFALIPLVIWVDEYKRLAVYFGGAYSMTVIQTLAMPFIVLAALNVGFIINVMFGKVKLDALSILIYVFAVLAGVIVFITMDAPWSERGQRAGSLAGYMTLIPITCAYLRNFDQWRKFIALQVLIALPAAAWAIKQYYFGFDAIEWEYARSGLSRVHYVQMMALEPRVFGFFGSASALGCAAIYCAFSVWHASRHKERRILWGAVGILYFVVLIVSSQRTALVYPFLVILPAFAFRTRLRTGLIYGAAAIIFVTGVLSSEYLLREGIDKTNDAIAVEGRWGEQVLKVSTFSDRLRGWVRLTKPESWSLLGTGAEAVSGTLNRVDVESADYNHDIINKILINYGAVGLLAVIIPLVIVLRAIHRTVFLLPDAQARSDAAFAVALTLPAIALSIVAGDNFTTNPINLQIWTCFAGVLVCRKHYQLEYRLSKSRMPQLSPIYNT